MSASATLVPPVRSVRAVCAVLAVLLLAPLALVGCRPPFESRYDIVPGPTTTAEVVNASLDEATPLTTEEWTAVDLRLDAYLAAYAELRASTIAAFVQQMREDRSNKWLADESALARMSKRAESVLSRIRALDESLASELATALPNRAAFVDRLRTRRAIDRALVVIAGHDEGGNGEGFLDLDIELAALLTRPAFAPQAAAIRAALEEQRASYRAALGTSAQQVAEALLEFPADRLRALRAAGVSESDIDAYVRASNRGATPELQKMISAGVRDGQARQRRALLAIDDLNERAAAAWAASMPAEMAEAFQSEALFRRYQHEAGQPVMRWYLEVVELLPEVQNGTATQTVRALRTLRQATDEYSAASIKAWRESLNEGAPSKANSDRAQELGHKLRDALQAATKAAEAELKQETRDKLKALAGAKQQAAREILAELVGPKQASRLVTRAPRSIFVVEDEKIDIDHEKSLAFQILLGRTADQSDFNRLAAALGADGNDAVTNELWARYRERAQALQDQQETALLAREKEIQDHGKEYGDQDGAFERDADRYIQELMEADSARTALINDAIGNLAAARGLADGDPRVVIARAQVAVTSSAVAWRMFQLPWLVGPLWLAQGDILPLVAENMPADSGTREDVVAVLAKHAPQIEQTALSGRTAGFSALRDFVSAVLRLQREGASGRVDPENLVAHPAMQSLIRRVRTAATARIEAQQALMNDLEQVLGKDVADQIRWEYARQTFPEFFAEHAWYDDAHSIAAAVAGVRVRTGTPAETLSLAAAKWRAADAAMIQELVKWQASPTAIAPPAKTQDLAMHSLEDGVLSGLRSTRDENALRLLRDAALAAGQPPDARMSGTARTVSRPGLRLSE